MTHREADEGELGNRNCVFSLLELKKFSRAKATDMTGESHFDV
jgi:hypothetical protein